MNSSKNTPFWSSVTALKLVLMVAVQVTNSAAQGQSPEPLAMPAVVAPGAELKLVIADCKFTEGPAADADGNVYFTDQPNDRILKVSVDGQVSEFMKPAGRSNGMFFAPDGKLIACADEQNQMWSIDVSTKTATVLFDSYHGTLLDGPNDVWVHPSGVMFFTDPFYQRPWWKHDRPHQSVRSLYRVSADAQSVEREPEPFKQPNGIVGDAKRSVLYVADIGDSKIYRYPIDADARLGKRELFCSEGSDGMTLDQDGNVYLTGGKGVTVYDLNGKRIGLIPVPEGWTANVCFGGKEKRTLFITASDSVYSIAMVTQGL